jgi:hypothetical protein
VVVAVVRRLAGAVAQATVTEPAMKGWNEQMYEKVPALANVTVIDAPGWMAPVSKLPALVAVCGWVLLFVQVTVVPTGTVMSAGSNLKSPIETASAAIGAAAVVAAPPMDDGVMEVIGVIGAAVVAVAALVLAAAVVADPLVLEDLASLPHAASDSAAAAPSATSEIRRMFTVMVRCRRVGG